MDEESVLARLPEAYAAALRLRRQGLDEGAIADQLGLERQAVGPLLRLAEAKLAALREPLDEPVPAERRAAPERGGGKRMD
jgi:DNA-directed RNA polymerase specialized sigma24 family protein